MRSTDQERTKFEAWVSTQSVVKKYGAKLFRSSCGNHYKDLRINQRWLAFKAGRAALQSQVAEDAERIQFMADEGCNFDTWKQEDGPWKYRLEWGHGTEWQTEWFSTPEEAIDHARRVEGENDA